jgi:hypothetical protein
VLPGTPDPGAKMPPALICVLPTDPTPESVPPAFTVTLDDVTIEPSTSSVPPLIVVAPL